MSKQSISVTLEPTTIEILKRIAAEEYRNISNTIDYIVAQYEIQNSVESAKKHGRAEIFAGSVQVTSFKETQKALKKNVKINKKDRDYIKENL